jgi:hypothetical protein
MSVARRENAQRPKSVLGTWNIPGNGVLRNFDLEVAEKLTFRQFGFTFPESRFYVRVDL